MGRLRRAAFAGAVGLAFALSCPAPASADLSFDELEDALEDFLDSLIEILLTATDLPALTDQLTAVLGQVGAAPHSHLVDGLDPALFPDESPVTVDAAAAHAAARNIDRQQRADEAMTTASVILDDLPATAADLAFLRVANRAWPVSLVAALQLGNEAEFLNVEELSKTNALLAQLGQVQVDQLVQDDYARQVAIEQAKAFYGAEGFTGGRVAAHTMNLPW